MNDLKTISGLDLGGLGQAAAGMDSRRAPEIPAEQFEGIFYSMMIKQLRQTLSDGGLFPGEQSDSYGSLFDMFMGQHLAESQPLGIARMLTRYQEASELP